MCVCVYCFISVHIFLLAFAVFQQAQQAFIQFGVLVLQRIECNRIAIEFVFLSVFFTLSSSVAVVSWHSHSEIAY